MKIKNIELDKSAIKTETGFKEFGGILIIIGVIALIVCISIGSYLIIGFDITVISIGVVFIYGDYKHKKELVDIEQSKINTLNAFIKGEDILVGSGSLMKKINISKGYTLSSDKNTISNKKNIFDLTSLSIKVA
jgi:hypothetical protein